MPLICLTFFTSFRNAFLFILKWIKHTIFFIAWLSKKKGRKEIRNFYVTSNKVNELSLQVRIQIIFLSFTAIKGKLVFLGYSQMKSVIIWTDECKVLFPTEKTIHWQFLINIFESRLLEKISQNYCRNREITGFKNEEFFSLFLFFFKITAGIIALSCLLYLFSEAFASLASVA